MAGSDRAVLIALFLFANSSRALEPNGACSPLWHRFAAFFKAPREAGRRYVFDPAQSGYQTDASDRDRYFEAIPPRPPGSAVPLFTETPNKYVEPFMTISRELHTDTIDLTDPAQVAIVQRYLPSFKPELPYLRPPGLFTPAKAWNRHRIAAAQALGLKIVVRPLDSGFQ